MPEVTAEGWTALAAFICHGPQVLVSVPEVTAEGWTALAAFMREIMTVLGTEIVHHPVGALDQAQAAA